MYNVEQRVMVVCGILVHSLGLIVHPLGVHAIGLDLDLALVVLLQGAHELIKLLLVWLLEVGQMLVWIEMARIYHWRFAKVLLELIDVDFLA